MVASICGYKRMLSALIAYVIRLYRVCDLQVIRLNGGHDPLVCIAAFDPHLFPGLCPLYSNA